MTPANAGYAPDGNGQPVWTEPNGEHEPEGSAPDWADYDGDNLATWMEGFFGSDPYAYDTDGDGIHDGDEVFTTHTNPTAWDTNGNGISDLVDYYGYYSGGSSGGDSSDTSSSSDTSDTSSSSDTSDSSSSSDSSDSTGGGVGFDPWDYSVDTDGDGISNGEESGVTMTDPQVVDTDVDGLTDGFELRTSGTNGTLWDTDGNGVSDFDDYFFPPTGVTDSDGDGLGDHEEFLVGTNPYAWDTDGDTLSDNEEVSIFLTSPFDAHSVSQGRGWGTLYTDWHLVDLTDSDGGGIPDRVEEYYGMHVSDSIDDLSGDLDGNGVVNVEQYNAGTDVRANVGVVYDRDSDGMSDVWELEYSLNPDDASDMGDDPDEDWITNREEYLLGLNPTVADTFWVVMERGLPEGLERGSGNQGLVDWDGDGLSNNEELAGGTDPRVENGGDGGDGGDGDVGGGGGGGGGGDVGGGGGGGSGSSGGPDVLPPVDDDDDSSVTIISETVTWEETGREIRWGNWKGIQWPAGPQIFEGDVVLDIGVRFGYRQGLWIVTGVRTTTIEWSDGTTTIITEDVEHTTFDWTEEWDFDFFF